MDGKLRALLKISGESLSLVSEGVIPGQGCFGIISDPLKYMVNEIRVAREMFNIVLAIVIGGGNFIRGADLKRDVFGENTPVADEMGMLATLINCICFKKILKQNGIESRVLSALECNKVCEPYIREVALSHLEKGRIVILAGGMGRPYHSTDSAMVMLAQELEMMTVLKGTKVDGIYTEDPNKNKDARFIPKISHDDYLALNLKIVDFSAVGFARQNDININVFNFFKEGNLKRVLAGEKIGSIICPATRAAR